MPGSSASTASAADTESSVQTIETGGIAAGDLGPLIGRHILEVRMECLARVRPRAVGVGVVGGPEDVLHSGSVALGDPGEILDERGGPLTVPVEARLLGQHRLGPE